MSEGDVLELLMFSGLMALGQFSPGPDMILLTRIALSDGRAAGMWAAGGIACGLMVHSALAIGGMAEIFNAGGMVALVVRALAAGYLLYLAWLLLRSALERRPQNPQPHRPNPIARGGSFRVGFLCNVLNPKAVVFFAAAVTPFLSGSRPLWWPWLLGGIAVLQGWLLWMLWVQVLQNPAIRDRYLRFGHGINAAFAVALLSLAFMLLTDMRSAT